MQSNTRRNFVKTLGLAGLVAVGVEGYQQATKIIYKQDELPTKELEALLEKKPVLQLNATYGTPKPRNPNSHYVIGFGEDYVEGTKKEVSVQIVPGPDGKLYVKENDTWRKI
jgi:hypothetical protein